jgi:hypothetical protein
VRVRERARLGGDRIWVSSSVFDIDRRIKEGDESGWRGDPSMFLMLNPATDMFEVWGIDRGGNQYMACSHHTCDHTLLQKLVAGDPTRHDVIAGVLEANEKAKRDREAADRDKALVVADKLGHAIRKDFDMGKRVHGMYDGKKV